MRLPSSPTKSPCPAAQSPHPAKYRQLTHRTNPGCCDLPGRTGNGNGLPGRYCAQRLAWRVPGTVRRRAAHQLSGSRLRQSEQRASGSSSPSFSFPWLLSFPFTLSNSHPTSCNSDIRTTGHPYRVVSVSVRNLSCHMPVRPLLSVLSASRSGTTPNPEIP